MTRRRLPIGMQTFRKLREGRCYYVDKTAYVRQLLDEGEHYFLSRPRRFGKSLFLDTCKELFEGNEPLFEGLAIHDRWDWSVRHPVLRLSFGSGNFTEPGYLHTNLMANSTSSRNSSAAVPATTRPRSVSDISFGRRARGPGSEPSSWSTSTTSRFSTHWTRRRSPAPTATSSAASTRSSRTATRTSGSASSPG